MSRNSLGGARRHVILSTKQEARLARIAKATGITASEHIRRAVDAYFRILDHAEERAKASTAQKGQ